jgi:hypothetical protein
LKETKKETNEGEPMKKVTTWGAALALLGMSASAFAQFSGGNLVVSLVRSEGGAALSNAASRHILRELTTSGTTTSASDVLIPGFASEVSGSNRRANISGSATSEGFINLSADGRYIVFVGYDAEIGTTGVVATTAATANRVIGRYEWQLAPTATSLNTSTFITDSFSGNNIRSATSNDGTQFWAAGANGGVRYTDSTLAAGTTTQIAATPANNRVIKIINGQLYVTTGSTTNNAQGIYVVGSGTPSTTGQTATRLFDTSIGGTISSSPYDFVIENANTVYIADDTGAGATTNGGLQKWTNGDTGWTNPVTYIIPTSAGTGRVGLRGLAQASSSVFYATTAETATRLIQITITGNLPTDVTVTTLATAATGEAFRDVELLASLNRTISGTISFQTGLENVPRNQELRVTLTPIAPSTGDPINLTVTPDANGNFTISAPPGNYRVRIKTAGTLSEAAEFNITTGNVTGANFTLRGGDINDDNAADITDLLALIGAYNTNTGGATDINGDGGTDITDLLILIGNYNQLGQD